MDTDTGFLKLSAKELLLRYRKHLPPGAYFYIRKDGDVRPAHIHILEIYVPFGAKSKKPENGVVFGFFEKGYPPADLAIKGSQYWLHRYPLSHDVASTSSEFQEKLASHLRGRLLNMHAPAGTRNDR